MRVLFVPHGSQCGGFDSALKRAVFDTQCTVTTVSTDSADERSKLTVRLNMAWGAILVLLTVIIVGLARGSLDSKSGSYFFLCTLWSAYLLIEWAARPYLLSMTEEARMHAFRTAVAASAYDAVVADGDAAYSVLRVYEAQGVRVPLLLLSPAYAPFAKSMWQRVPVLPNGVRCHIVCGTEMGDDHINAAMALQQQGTVGAVTMDTIPGDDRALRLSMGADFVRRLLEKTLTGAESLVRASPEPAASSSTTSAAAAAAVAASEASASVTAAAASEPTRRRASTRPRRSSVVRD